MPSVTVHAPKTPVTKGSNGIAAATVPNVCKMPGPPAPFVPTPLPNIGKSGLSPQGYSTSVTIEGHVVAIKGATFGSMGDIASKATGGGLISANTHGPTAFVAPGSLTVTIEGKNVHLLGDATTNNNGSPPNASTVAAVQSPGVPALPLMDIPCSDAPASSSDKMSDCEKKQICAKCEQVNKQAKAGKLKRSTLSKAEKKALRRQGNNAAATHKRRLGNCIQGIGSFGRKMKKPVPPESIHRAFAHPCAHEEWMEAGADPEMPGLSSDHVHEIQLGGAATTPANLKLMSSKANEWMGTTLKNYDPAKYSGVKPDCCD